MELGELTCGQSHATTEQPCCDCPIIAVSMSACWVGQEVHENTTHFTTTTVADKCVRRVKKERAVKS